MVERKLATVLFVDLVGSTDLLTEADPEVVRRRVGRFFDQVSHCILTHGGTVEKFAGDAVMAAFGVPLQHEDDAERAVRAALATLERVRELGLEARIGIEAGEVVADESESTFATGEAVNLAARLEQRAAPNEILVGPTAARLVRDLVELEPVEPLELRGWPRPIRASRVVCALEPGRPLRSLAAPLVGRESELDLLENTFARTVRDRRATLVTLYGEPGVGKSRLAREFVEGLEGATVLRGRCLPYGEGVTYWPVAEMVKASAGISDDDPLDRALEKLRETCEDEAVADLLGLAVGVLEAVEGERSQQEIAWAARSWAEQLADAQPLVLLFEDVHWGEEPLLELIEHLAGWVRTAPLLLVCLARPELLDVRPAWGGGRMRAVTLELEALPDEESRELVVALAGEVGVPVDVPAVLEKAEGNPLFVEETIRALAERPDGRPERIPDTLQALIAARIDRLSPAPRRILQRASVMGRVFLHGALAHLSPDVDDVDAALDELLLRDFVIHEERSAISGEQAFKFKHVLIREVAYAGLAKGSRADLHLLFAGWLGERAGDELVEIRGFHLDQATRLLAELDGSAPPELAEEAAGALTQAGRRALSRESFRSARRLLVRAVELAPTLERRYLAARAAWRLSDLAAVAVEMERVRAEAAQTGDRTLEGRALTALAEAVLNQRADAMTARALAEQAVEVLADDEPDVRFEAFRAAAGVASWLSDDEAFERWAKLALEAARAADRKDQEIQITMSLAESYIHRLDLAEAEPLVERIADLARESGSVVGQALALVARGALENWRGNDAESEAAYAAAQELYREIGNAPLEASSTMMLGRLSAARGDLPRAEKLLLDAVRTMKGSNDRARLCEAQRSLAEVYVDLGRLEEAERYALEARESVGPEDRVSLSTTKLSLGIVRAAQGRDGEAQELMTEGLEDLRALGLRAPERWALGVIAGFLRSRGREAEAARYDERLAELAPAGAAPIA
ncbi:MAG TPA: AAA family ATPase [Gaiellaceae bacterium]|jgi:class 3 adenylate cyclase/tetratricopeptide (TPR) repeat protein|nr:AAA family ATPase [Gaiellaceae bacterium]